MAGIILAGVSCGHARPAGESLQSQEIIEVADAEYVGPPGDPLEAACRDWRLSARQVATFFQLGQRYEQRPYAAFYQVPCSISGKLRAEGKTWDFVIGGGGTAIWTHGEEERHFGCSADACEPLVLLPTDLMGP